MTVEPVDILIVDDEPEARDLLILLLKRIEGVRLAGTAGGVDEAFRLIAEEPPDLVLLDIQMPGKDGFELVEMVLQHPMEVGFVFVTAHNEYIIRAIRSSAFDYLLKPVDPVALAEAIDRYRERMRKEDPGLLLDGLLKAVHRRERMKVNTRTGFLLIDPWEIIYCRAAGNYTEVYLTKERKETITSNLGTFSDMLSGFPFFRISRSALINMDFLVRVDNRKGICTLRTAPPTELPVTKNRRQALEMVCGGLPSTGSRRGFM